MADQLLRLNFQNFPVRGALAQLQQKAWLPVMEKNPCPPAVQTLLGEALAAAALLTSNIKFDGQIAIQLQGEGPVQLLLTQCTDGGGVRGIVRASEVADDAGFAELTGGSLLTITIEQSGGRRYQGVVPLEGDTLARALEGYFLQSEQLETRIWLAGGPQAVGGLMLQRIPQPDVAEDSDGWERVVTLADTLSAQEILGLPGLEVLHRLFHEERLTVDTLGLAFYCPCSRDRVVEVLRSLGREEILKSREDAEDVTVDCEFCNERYRFDAVDLEALFNPLSMESPSRTRQ